MTPEYSPVNAFQYPVSTRKLTITFSVLTVVLVTYAIFVSEAGFVEKVFTFALVAGIATILNLEVLGRKIIVDNAGIRQQSFLFSTNVRWREIDDLVHSPRFLLLTAAEGRRRIVIFRGEYGFSLEPFDELRNDVVRRVEDLLARKWNEFDLRDGRVYTYPFAVADLLGYLVSLSLVLFFFVIVPLWIGLFQREQLLLLVLAMLTIGIFFVRDWRRQHKTIILRADGILQNNGRSILIPWMEVERLTIKETWPGYGSIVIEGRRGYKIFIRRKIRRCGELLFLLRKHGPTTMAETLEHEII